MEMYSIHSDPPDNKYDYIGFGFNASIVRRGGQAIKQPRKYLVQNTSDSQAQQDWLADISKDKINHEKTIYHHLGEHDRIVKACFDLESDEPIISMPYMSNRSLDQFLLQQTPDARSQIALARQFITAVAYCHAKNVLIGDIGSRNCLLDSDLSLKLCDFGDSCIIEAGCNILEANDSGVTVKTDIAKVGVVLYEICTGQILSYGGRQEPDFFEDDEENLPSSWPTTNLPPTDGLLFGEIIRRCWTKAYRNVNEVANDLSMDIGTLH